MKPNQSTNKPYEELLNKPLTDSEVAEMVASLTMFIEMLAEIDKQKKELSKTKHKEKE